MYLVIFIAGIAIIKFVLNFSRLIETLIIFRIFQKQPKNVAQYCPFATALFNAAGTQQVIISTIRTNGLSQARQDYISNSLDKKDSYFALETIFQKAIGVYKFRISQSVNPFYWLFLPKYLLMSYSIEFPSFIEALLNLVYWFLGVVLSYFLGKYLDLHYQDLVSYIRSMLI